MRSKLFVCAALAGLGLCAAWSPVARAADPKSKSKKKSGDGLSDDKAISKQLQWEDSVMGPDDKRAELDKIARAQAINKAAAEKAEREKEKAAAAAAKEPPSAPKAQTQKRGGEVALPTLPDEGSTSGSKGKASEVSPKLETAAAAAPPPPVKHGDDKFIDKLLKDEPGARKHKGSAADDKALDDLLATDKPAKAPTHGKGKHDDVDALLTSADKAPPMPETKVKHETPEWAKPEIQSTPEVAPVAVRPVPKRNDGIIHVVQGAVAPQPAAARGGRAPVASSSRKTQTSSRPAGWSDPFAEAPKKTVAAREARGSFDDDEAAPEAPRRRASAAPASERNGRDADTDENDSLKSPAGTRRATPAAKPAKAPAHGGAWKDPFTENVRPSPARGMVAKRVTTASRASALKAGNKRSKATASHGTAASRVHVASAAARATLPKPEARKIEPTNKWSAAERHRSVLVADAGVPAGVAGAGHGGWGVLKKHAAP